ncbi:MAG: SPFH domain-containing protein [Oscillospiraceae bacterium]|jgi:membrane protease subunit (stomatin/prohibitin family)|nr:SPFH domain-containing protein [Oscillospiraceae bacterium]
MGLIKAILGAAGGTLADQWKEFFVCESMDKNVLVCKGEKKVSGRSSNTKGSDNVISDGSGVVVADGQCMIIVEQGKVVEVCSEPGQFTYRTDLEPSIFTGSLGESILATFKEIGKRFQYGGEPAKDQRVYYFNLKELIDNKFGTPNPVPFRVVDKNIGLDMDIALRCNGVYSYKIVNPLLFYTNVCGNVERDYTRDEIDSQLKSEFLTALQPAFAKISDMGIRYSSIPAHTMELADALNEVLTKKWTELRGLAVVSVGVNSINASKEDEDTIKALQKSAVMRDPTMAAANLVSAQADAMKMAASNEGGAMNGFIGLNMAGQAGGMNASDLFAMGAKQQAAAPAAQAAAPADSWTCPKCGTKASGKFCPECGEKKPAEEGWTCSCGAVNKGKFCSECGAKRPAGAPIYQCDKCGWQPEDPHNPPKFCPECGDVFDDNDIK